MKQIIQNNRTGKLELNNVPPPLLMSKGLLIQNFSSLISAGTEKASIDIARKNLLGKAKERPDEAKKVIRSVRDNGITNTFKIVMDRLNAPTPKGYSCAGVVIAVGDEVEEFQTGDRVACAGANYASHAEVVWVPKNLCVKIPIVESHPIDDGSTNNFLSFEESAFVTLGSIAMQGVRQANIKLGEKVAVIGLGLLGQITVQLLKASGCEVIGADLETKKLELAGQLGADLAVKSEKLKVESEQFTNGRGVDAVIITAATKSNQPIELAGEIARQKGKVVVVGRIGMNVPRDIYYQKELDLRLSMSYGPGRYDKEYEEKGHDYPYGYVRWTEKRNMESFLALVAHGKINVRKLITHRFQIEEAMKAYDMIMNNTESYLGVILEYNDKANVINDKLDKKINIKHPSSFTPHPSGVINIGIIGSGNFARGVLIPRLRKIHGVNIKGICTATGISARSIADKLKCDYCTTDYKQILSDGDIHAVVIATRHNTHAGIVIDALKASKHVFVEKPLAMNEDELEEIKDIHFSLLTSRFSPNIMVGFNRRFSPHAKRLFDHFSGHKNPLIMNYRVNAGPIEKDHWVQDPLEGGGRIIGEVCHFIDFLQFISGAEPQIVYAQQIGYHSSGITNDNCLINIRFSDNSIGSISYIASGDTSLPKERIEIFGDGRSAVVNNFKKTELYGNNNKNIYKTRKQDKGHKGELDAFIDAIKKVRRVPIRFESLYLTTLTTFKIHESFKTGLPIDF